MNAPHRADRYAARHAVILAHPGQGSFNAAVADTYCETVRACGQEAIVRDLYAIGFDPLLKEQERPHKGVWQPSADVRAELDLLAGTDVLVLVHPVWFGMPPAMMKGYVDRVLGAGVTADQVQRRAGQSILTGRRLLSITSSGASRIWLDERGQQEAMRTLVGRYLLHAFGMKSADTLHFGEVVEGLSGEFVDQNLRDVQARARTLCAELEAERAA